MLGEVEASWENVPSVQELAHALPCPIGSAAHVCCSRNVLTIWAVEANPACLAAAGSHGKPAGPCSLPKCLNVFLPHGGQVGPQEPVTVACPPCPWGHGHHSLVTVTVSFLETGCSWELTPSSHHRERTLGRPPALPLLAPSTGSSSF